MIAIVMWLGMSGCLLGPTDLTNKENLLQNDPITASGTLAVTGIFLEDEIYTNSEIFVQIEMNDENGEEIDDPLGFLYEQGEIDDFLAQLHIIWTIRSPEGDEETVTGLAGEYLVLEPDQFERGDEVTASLEYGGDDQWFESNSIIVRNSLPVVHLVEISPQDPTVGQSLTCSVDAGDEDEDNLTYAYTWTDPNGQTVERSSSVAQDILDDIPVAGTWTCAVSVSDDVSAGASEEASVVVSEAGPSQPCFFSGDCDESLSLGNDVGLDLVLLSNGTFNMGSPNAEVGRGSDEDQRTVTLSNDFYVMTTEITQGMFESVMEYPPHVGEESSSSDGSYGIGDDYPAYYMSWHMSAAFANAVTAIHNSENGTSLQECYSCIGSGTGVECTASINPYQCDGYRLLTEAEWEYASRAGTTSAFWTLAGGAELPSGYDATTYTLSDGFDLRTYAWPYWTTHGTYGSQEVAQLLSNDFGLYDMSGNVWEWVHDHYDGGLGTSPVTDPLVTSGNLGVIRGGSWGSQPNNLRSAERGEWYVFSDRNYMNGARLGRTMFHKCEPTNEYYWLDGTRVSDYGVTNWVYPCSHTDHDLVSSAAEWCVAYYQAIAQGCSTPEWFVYDCSTDWGNNMGYICEKSTINNCGGSTYNGSCYERFTTSGDWFAARNACQAWGGELVVMQDQAEQSFVESILPETIPMTWIGIINSEGGSFCE